MQTLHQMMCKPATLRKFSGFTILTAKSEKQTYFMTIYSTIFWIKEVIWSKKDHLKSVHWSKYNTWFAKITFLLTLLND